MTYWWERRRQGEATAEYLGRVLDELGATDMAQQARACHYDDYFCPPDVDDGANIHRLIGDVGDWGRSATRDQRERAKTLLEAAINGEFDGTREESEAWAASPDGQETLRDLLGGR